MAMGLSTTLATTAETTEIKLISLVITATIAWITMMILITPTPIMIPMLISTALETETRATSSLRTLEIINLSTTR